MDVNDKAHGAHDPAGSVPPSFPDRDEALAAVMPALARQLGELGIPTMTTTHDAVFTVDESQALRGRIPGAHTKNLFVKDKKGRLFLVVAQEDTAVDLKTLHGKIGGQGRLSFASPEQMRERLGVEPGAVTAFGVVNDRDDAVTIVLDERLLAHDIVNCHPLTNRATTSIARTDLMALFACLRHDPLVVSLESGADEHASGQTS